jgi:hypothetical protein
MTPYVNNASKVESATSAKTASLYKIIPKKSRSKIEPTNPHSSAKAAKIKSVLYSGRKLSRDCVPKPTPFPYKPPDPTAIVD